MYLTILHHTKGRIALQVARKIALCDRALIHNNTVILKFNLYSTNEQASGYVPIAFSHLMITSLLQVVNKLGSS